MKRLGLLAFLLCAPALHAQVPPEKAVSTFKVSDGLEISLWASEPLFVNPTCMDIDPQGRVWVCESVNYRHKLLRRKPNRPEGDRILILEDSQGTGKADKVTVFYQSPDTLAPLGIAVLKHPEGPGYTVFVCQSPDILVFEDKDGDGKADGPPRKLLTGFRGVDHDHGVHGIFIGPDNKLYFSVGDQGVQGLVDKHGKKWTTNVNDCRAGTNWRCDLDGKNLELLADNFRNQYEPCADSFGTMFVSDNDDDGNQQTRICYVMPGGNYGYWPRRRGDTHWHEEQPGVVPKILRTYFGSPTGICVYEGNLLPEKYRGQLLHADAGPRHVRCYHLKPNGASYEVDREDMVESSDNWFRPSDVCVAPDGSVFVCDWYDPGVGGHGMGDIQKGRIFRIAPKGNRPSVPKLDLESPKGITAALASPCLSVRAVAMAKLDTLGQDEAVRLLDAAATQKENVFLRARALWQLGRRGSVRLVNAAYSDPDLRFRVLAMRILHDFRGLSPAEYVEAWRDKLVKDESAAVRREGLLLLRDAPTARAKPLILELAKRYDGKDRFYLEAINIALGQDKARRDAVLGDFAKQFPQWNEQVASLIWGLNPPNVLPLLRQRLTEAKTSAKERREILDTLAGTSEPDAGQVTLAVLRNDASPEVRDRAAELLRTHLPGKWKVLRESRDFQGAIDALLKQEPTRLTALALIGAAEDSHFQEKVADLARNAQEPLTVRQEAVRTLGRLKSDEATGQLLKMVEIRPEPLAEEVVLALGRSGTPAAMNALTDMARDKGRPLPLRQVAVAALAGSRPGTTWLLKANKDRQLGDDLTADLARLLRNSPYPDLRNQALIAFPPPGKLDPKRLPSLYALLARKGKVERGRQLMSASLKSDLQCLKCHAIHGVGGAVGPDLSVIGKKASRENLLESILYPSKAIADQYVTWVVETKGGLSISGLLVEDVPGHVVLRDANAKDHKIDRGQIDTKVKSPVSLMPDNLVGTVSEDDLLDVVDYLHSLKTPSFSPNVWHVIGPFPGDGTAGKGMKAEFGPEKKVDLNATYAGKHGKVAWRKVQPNAQGYVDLRALHAPHSDSIVSYLYCEVESPAAQDATVLLGTDDQAYLWFNGKQVYQNTQHRPAMPEQDRVPVRLQPGRNTFLLKINNGDGEHGFYLSVRSEQELKLLSPR
jgi:putative membrane-bound dehydrogenase-like protein